ncbi:MAG TPA: tetratricopeptide repeat protein [Pyrinomonadaceae bacterium]|nr:tetratricopeptide repeat protein [Pyrinomonadaceae bacterium]
MNKSFKTKSALLLLALACAPCAAAQEPPAKPAEAVRVRRATEAQKPAQSTTTNAAVAEPTPKEKAATETTETAEAGAPAEAQGATADSSLSPAERARQRQATAERLAASGDRAEAVTLLRSMLAEQRFDPAFFYNTGNALARMGESEAAVDAYRKAVSQRRGNYARAQHNLGVVLTRLGRWEEAEEALTAALKLESFTYAEASYSLGRLHALRGESGLAMTEWARTLRLKPDHAEAAVALARLLADGGDTQQALATLDALSERLSRRGVESPREIAVARGEIVAASNVVEDSRARVVVPRAEVRGADSKAAGVERVSVKSNPAADASDSGASAVLRNARAASTRPLVASAAALDLLRRARVAREGGRDADAVALYRRAVESNGGYFAPANLEMGYTLASLRRNEEAAASVLSVIKREGTRFPIAFYHVARFYEHMNRLAEAEEAFARAAELMGDRSPQFYIDLSRVRERAGDNAGALAAAEEYVRLSARNGSAPDWARARVEQLRKKSAQPAGQESQK